jgi:rhodanese-related sulfurtransferase
MQLPGAKLVAHPELITFEELEQLRAAGAPVRILDVRTERGYQEARLQGAGAIRIAPNRPAESAASLALPKNEWLVAYCA